MVRVPDKFADLFSRDKRAFAFLALVERDGTPQVTPIWFDYDGTYIIINTARRRVKDKILGKHPHVAVAIQDPENPYRYIQLRGKVVEETEVGGYDMICRLNEKYHGKYEYPKRPGEMRVTHKIHPEQFNTVG